MSSDKQRFEGFVAVFYPDKFYGFITQDLPGTSSSPGIYFGTRDIRPDWRGSTAYAWGPPGTPVSFLKVKRPSKKYDGTWTAADDVYPLFADEPAESLETYGETSRVRSWNRCFGELQRECGDRIFFHKSSVLDRFKHLLINLNVGDYVYHSVGKREDGRWHAVGVELFSAAEQERLLQGLPAQEPESEPEPALTSAVAPEPTVVETQSELLCPKNCKRTLLEIMQSRKI
jgi:hypothetical protein